jgi:hypothetical protein
MIKYALFPFTSIDNFFDGLKLFLYHIDYIMLVSLSLSLIPIFLFIILFKRKEIHKIFNTPLAVVIFYMLISLILLIISTISFIYFTNKVEIILGRYIEPIIPLIMLIGIISLYKLNKLIKNEREMVVFTIFYITSLLLVIFSFTLDNALIRGFGGIVNNPGLYSFTTFFGPHYGIPIIEPIAYVIPLAFIVLFFLVFITLIYLYIKTNKYICFILLFIMFTSILFSIQLYHFEYDYSISLKNDIGEYLYLNTHKNTTYLIDSRSFNEYTYPPPQRYAICNYGFWNKGNTHIIDARNTPLSNDYCNNDTYLLSTIVMPYQEVANNTFATNQTFRLYKL